MAAKEQNWRFAILAALLKMRLSKNHTVGIFWYFLAFIAIGFFSTFAREESVLKSGR
jgi:hypothetical protein